jgi:integrase
MERSGRYRLKLYRGTWNVVWTEGGETKRASLRTRDPDEAARRFTDWQRALERIGPTVADIMGAYLKEKDRTTARPDRLRDAWKALGPFFGHMRPDQIGRPLCRAYTARRRQAGRKNGTIRKELDTLRAGLRWQDRNTSAVFEMPPAPPPRHRHLTKAEYRKLLAACSTPHVRLFVILALATAGRAEALLGLTWERVDLDRGLIRLSDDGERRKGRATVPMTESARAALLDAQKAARTGFVIEYADRRVQSVKKGIKNAAARAKLRDVSPHVFRHSAAVWMAEAGVPMSEIAQYLGHSDSRLTERVYARYSPTYLRRAAEALEA